MTCFINLTPHTINIFPEFPSGSQISIPKSVEYPVLGISERMLPAKPFHNVSVNYVCSPGEQTIDEMNLKLQEILDEYPNHAVLVSRVVLDYVQDKLRDRVFAPDTRHAVRNKEGHIVGVGALIRKKGAEV